MGTTYCPNDDQSIAIVGLSCRLPGDVESPEGFWHMLRDGVSASGSIPPSRWNARGFRTASNTKGSLDRGHFLSGDISAFDASFFATSQAEAASTDLQQRLMLEVAYEAFENAGLSLERLSGSQTGVFIASFSQDWKDGNTFADLDAMPQYALSGSQSELISNRISYAFNLQGPSLSTATACSGSLVALHLACQSLRAGDCDTAVVGGANLILGPGMSLALAKQGFLAPDGLCKAFDASADGYGRGEGFVAMALKPVRKALRDGDHIRAIIRATGTNQDGKTKGITMPNSEAQEKLIRATYRAAGLRMQDTSYFEAHGTGTQAGDLAELGAVSRTIARARHEAGHPDLWIGSAKTNVGHTESSAGLVGVLKAVLMLERELIPQNLHFHNPNPCISFDKWHVRVPTSLIPWSSAGVRRISCNSFGFGGSNAHAILDDAASYLKDVHGLVNGGVKSHRIPSVTISKMNGNLVNGNAVVHRVNESLARHRKNSACLPDQPATGQQRLLMLTSNDQESLTLQRKNLARYLRDRNASDSGVPLNDLAYTLTQKRSRLPWRTFASAANASDLAERLEENSPTVVRAKSTVPHIAFIFTGQGAQWARMGVGLLQYGVFRESVEAADLHLRQYLGSSWSVLTELSRDESTSLIQQPLFSQTLCTIVQVALVELLASWGVRPRAVVGHSSGEMAAAFSIGALRRQDAWTIAYWRGKLSTELMQSGMARGAMMALGASKEEAIAHIAKVNKTSVGKCVVACVNSPSSVTVSGDVAAIDELAVNMKAEGVFARKLKVDMAYHSHHMKAVEAAYLEALKDTTPLMEDYTGDGPYMFTSVSETLAHPSSLGGSHWVQNLVSPVLFASAVQEMMQYKYPGDQYDGPAVDIMIEIGPHAALRGPVMQTLQSMGLSKDVEYLSLLSRGTDSVESTLQAVGHLTCRGVPINLAAVNGGFHHAKLLVDLPPYAWNHSKSYWTESRLTREMKQRSLPASRLLGSPMPAYGADEFVWRSFLRPADHPWIAQHKVHSAALFPAGGFLAIILEAAHQVAFKRSYDAKRYRLRHVRISKAVIVSEDSNVEMIAKIRPGTQTTGESSQKPSMDESSWWEFEIATSTSAWEDLQQNCSGFIALEMDSDATDPNQLPLDVHMPKTVDCDDPSATDEVSSIKLGTGASEFYDRLGDSGLQYGEAFQMVTEVKRDDESMKTSCSIKVPQLQQNCSLQDMPVPDAQGQPDSGNTLTISMRLESMVQAAYAAFHWQKANPGSLERALTVTEIDELLLYQINEPFVGTNTPLRASARASRQGLRQMVADVRLVDATTSATLVSMNGLRCVEVSGVPNSQASLTDRFKDRPTGYEAMVSKTIWQPALELLSSPKDLQGILEHAFTPREDSLRTALQQEIAAFRAVTRAIERARSKRIPNVQMRNATKWLAQQLKDSSLAKIADDDEQLCEDLESMDALGHTLELLLGGKEAVDELTRSDVGTSDLTAEASHARMCKYIAILAHINPTLSILELGSPASISFLNTYNGIPNTVAHTFASQDAGLIDQLASANDGTQKLRTEFVYIDGDINSQGAHLAQFDIVVASNLLSRASNATATLERIQNLLKPGGKLCLMEMTSPSPFLMPKLGIIDKWWRKRDDGLSLPLTENCICQLLAHQHFKIETTCQDLPQSPLRQTTIMIATNHREVPASDPHVALTNGTSKHEHPLEEDEVLLLLGPNPSDASSSLASQLELSMTVNTARMIKWNTAETGSVDFTGKQCISLLELDTPFLNSLTESDFNTLSQILTKAASLLWVTALPEPHCSTVLGLARVQRFEVPSVRCRTLNLQTDSIDGGSETLRHTADLVLQVYHSTSEESEYKQIDGVVHVPRIDVDPEMNEYVPRFHLTEDTKHACLEALPPVGIHVRTPGNLNTLCFREIPEYSTEAALGDDEVEIQAKASGLSYRDTLIALGQIIDTDLGIEASGIVVRKGHNVSHLRPGDRVVTLHHGAHRSLIRSKATLCQPLPTDMPFGTAATTSLAYCTAYHALVNIARVRRDQTILMHRVPEATAAALVQFGRHLELSLIVVTTKSDASKAVLISDGLSENHILDLREYQDDGLAARVLKLTNNTGVDCCLVGGGSSVTEDQQQNLRRCLSRFGTYVELIEDDIRCVRNREHMPNNGLFAKVDMLSLLQNAPEAMAQIMQETFNLVRRNPQRFIARPPSRSYRASEVSAAMIHHLAEPSSPASSVALLFPSDDVVPVLYNPSRALKLSASHTYLITGGLGGIGRNIALLLADNGAKHLCLLSRSGMRSDAQGAFLQQIRARGINVKVYQCDVSCQSSLRDTLTRCTKEDGMPPIKGIIHCASVSDDAVIPTMTHAQWKRPLKGKIDGSWNLHRLNFDVDFFLCVGSFMGIVGGRGQANYSAGSAFQDGLATMRREMGLPAVTIDLGIVKGFGMVEESGAVGHTAEWREPFGVDERELHALVKAAIVGQLTTARDNDEGKRRFPAQLISSIPTSGMVDDAGVSVPYYFEDPRFCIMAARGGNQEQQDSNGTASSRRLSLRQTLTQTTTEIEATHVLTDAVRTKVAQNMQLSPDDVDAEKSLHSYGLDSLSAVEIVGWARKELGAEISVFDVMASMPIRAFAAMLLAKGDWKAASLLLSSSSPPPSSS